MFHKRKPLLLRNKVLLASKRFPGSEHDVEAISPTRTTRPRRRQPQVTKDALESCCLASKSRVPRTRKHLSPMSASEPRRTFSYGKARFRIPSPPLRTTLQFCPSDSFPLAPPPMQKRVAGFQHATPDPRPPSSRSMGFHLRSNPFTWISLQFYPRTFSTSFTHPRFSRTFVWGPNVDSAAAVVTGSQQPSSPTPTPRLPVP